MTKLSPLDETQISWSEHNIEGETVSPLLNTSLLAVEFHGAGCGNEKRKIWHLTEGDNRRQPGPYRENWAAWLGLQTAQGCHLICI